MYLWFGFGYFTVFPDTFGYFSGFVGLDLVVSVFGVVPIVLFCCLLLWGLIAVLFALYYGVCLL